MDKILIRDLKIFAYHGVNEEEKVNGQNFIFDIDLSVNMIKACYSTTCLKKRLKSRQRQF